MLKIVVLIILVSCNLSKKLNKENNEPKNNEILKKKVLKNDFKEAYDLVVTNNINGLKKIIDKNYNVLGMNYSHDNTEQSSLLMEALYFQEKTPSKNLNNVIEFLFESSDLNAIDSNGYSILHYSVFNGEYVKKLLNNDKIDVNLPTKGGEKTPLMLALEKGYFKGAYSLLEVQNIKLGLIDRHNRNILHFLVTGIFKAPKISHEDSENLGAEYLKMIVYYKNILKILIKGSYEFNFEKALKEDRNIEKKTPLEVFNELMKPKIEESRKYAKIPPVDKVSYGRNTLRGMSEREYWEAVENLFKEESLKELKNDKLHNSKLSSKVKKILPKK